MHINTLKEKGKKALPENHPFLKELLEYETTPDIAFELLVEIINDWERGIRDWSEVRDHIDRNYKEQ